MKTTDYIVELLIGKGITDVFGYPGGSAANLMASFDKYKDQITAHVCYHEQAAAFSACGYAATSGKPGVVYTIGGPGATNLMTGIGHAYYDSIPLICLTGNINTYESARGMRVRQRGFQESDIVSVVKPLTKYCVYIEKPKQIVECMKKAWFYATEGRPGPVLIDLPMDVSRAPFEADETVLFDDMREEKTEDKAGELSEKLADLLRKSNSPCIVLGNGVKKPQLRDKVRKVIDHLQIPYVTSMIAFDVLGEHCLRYGFLGAYGDRAANFIAAKSDLIISLGSRMDIRQVGLHRDKFAPDARIVRVDIDEGELEYRVHENEYDFQMQVEDALNVMISMKIDKDYSHWRVICNQIRDELKDMDERLPNRLMKRISALIPDNAIITTDVGQNQVWVAQSFALKNRQRVLFSGGMGAMGHALPAAIGAHYGSGGLTVCICGDGGMQMNIQEMQFLARERIPVKVIVFNNQSLGMIRHFQEMYFEGNYYQTKPEGGYSAPDFTRIAEAYGIQSTVVESTEDIGRCKSLLSSQHPALIEVRVSENTYVFPKLEFGKPNQDQEPLMNRELYNRLMKLH